MRYSNCTTKQTFVVQLSNVVDPFKGCLWLPSESELAKMTRKQRREIMRQWNKAKP